MKKFLILFLALCGTVCMVNCSPKTTGAVATQRPKETTEVKSSYTAAAELAEGQTVWMANCDKCHKLYEPASHSKEAWEGILPSMGRKAKLEKSQVLLIKAYLFSQIQG